MGKRSIIAFAAAVIVSNVAGAEESVKFERDTALWLGEVSVTAIKQNRDLTLQPTSRTVINGKEIDRLNIVTMKNASEIAPNFYIPDYGSRMTSSIYVRGIGARIDQPVVGLNVDNVPFLNKDNYDFDLGDIERVEVLRGPQTTLYGRNTMGGQINIYTPSPLRYAGTRVMVSGDTGPGARVSVSHYQRFQPNFGMSFSGYFNYSDGFYSNKFNGSKVGRDESGSLRWKTEWLPSPSVTISNIAAFALTRQHGYPYEYEKTGEINYNDTCYYRRNGFTDGLTVNWSTDNFKLSSISSVQYLDDDMTLDQDFLPLDYFTLSQRRHEWVLTQDVVARGNVGSYDWIGGVFAFYKHTFMDAPVTFKEDGIKGLITDRINSNDRIPVRLEWNDPTMLLGSDFKIPVWGIAAYHQSALDLGAWNLALGLRLDYEKTSLSYHSLCNTGFSVFMKSGMPPRPIMVKDLVIDKAGKLDNDFLEFMPKFTVSYDLPMAGGSNVYASVGEGYKSGGYNTQMFSEFLQQALMAEMMESMPNMGGKMPAATTPDVDEIISYKPEKSYNYEIGTHVSCAGGRVETDVALFYIDCRDQQLTMFPEGTTTGRVTTNAGKTRSFGAEVQIRYAPVDRWLFNLSYGYTNAKFREFRSGMEDYAGKTVPYAPQNTLFAGVTYEQPVGGFLEKITFDANVRGVGRIYWDESNEHSQNFYAQLGAQATFHMGCLSASVWGENITDSRFNTFSFESIGNTFYQRGKPARGGITLRMTF